MENGNWWVGLLGSFVGGGLTFVGVWWESKMQREAVRESEKSKERHERDVLQTARKEKLFDFLVQAQVIGEQLVAEARHTTKSRDIAESPLAICARRVYGLALLYFPEARSAAESFWTASVELERALQHGNGDAAVQSAKQMHAARTALEEFLAATGEAS